MSNKLDDLITKFNEEGNTTGERLADALKSYLCDFTEELKKEILSDSSDEKEPNRKKVLKIENLMIRCEEEGDYTQQHMFPMIDKTYNILSAKSDDSKVLEKINEGINNCQNGKDIVSPGNYKYRIPVGYIYVNADKTFLDNLINNGKRNLVVTDKTGKKHRLGYYLVWSDSAVSNCKKMWRLSRLYKDEEPIVFAPYAKRLFRVEVDVEELVAEKGIQIESVDFLTEENGLENILLFDKELVWNVKTDNQKEFTKSHTPVGNVVHWRFFFKDLKPFQYIIPKIISWPTFRIESMKENDVCLEFENEYDGEFESITIYNADVKISEKPDVFRTNYNPIKMAKQHRIRSLTDAYYEVKKFEGFLPKDVKIYGVQDKLPNGKQIIDKYPSNMSVYDKGRFGYKNTNRLYVVFDCENRDLLVDDYFNFVLGYLTFCFPEIGWEGAV